RPTEPRPDSDAQWVHDKAPTAPRADLARSPPAAAPNSKLLVSNLHYEITPKDLTYDRSGRSSGTAIVSFETATEATRAKKQFDGILARGQPMTIGFDTAQPPRAPRRSASVPTSLLNRIQKAPLLDRLSRDDSTIKKSSTPPSGPRNGLGPIRSKPARSGGRGGERAPRAVPKKAKTAEELDKELDAFMGDSESTAPAPAAEAAAETQTTAVEVSIPQDVEMA
ncbi:hypothetical protein H0H87_001114, partial [Tephrocybe sp. NHM501043]